MVIHGDAGLPNLMAEADQFTDIIDCSRLDISDSLQNLALAARSIERNLGMEWGAQFFQKYGVVPDEQRIGFLLFAGRVFLITVSPVETRVRRRTGVAAKK